MADLLIIIGTLGLALAASFLVLWSIQKYLTEYAKRTKTKIDDVIVSVLKGPIVLLIISYGVILSVRALAGGNPSQGPIGLFESIDLAFVFVLFLIGTWSVAKVFVIIMQNRVQRLAVKTQSKTDDLVVRVSAKVGNTLIIVVGFTVALALLWMTLGLLKLASGQ